MKSYRFWIGCVGPKAWRWYLIAPNGQFIAESHNEYARRSDAEKAVRVLAECFGAPGYRTILSLPSGKPEYLMEYLIRGNKP